ncbi:MAG TPA: ABC transporter substrate-binding protein [Trebonia sp.]|nr:ABC transporter substrate-binding protein [Trebonia sp.]
MPRIGLRRGSLAALAAACATALTVAACSSGSSAPAASGGSSGSNAALPTVTMMVGGINKQIYLPYQLAQSLGYYKKYGVNMVLSNEVAGGVGAETAMASGQVNMAGAWYVHTINFQLQGKAVVDVAQLSGSPGERIMCATGTHITSQAQWKGQTVGVTDIGSGTDQLTQYLAARYGLTKGDYTRIGAGDGSTMIAALKNHKILCGMTTQPTVAAIEKLGVGYPAFDLTTTAGVKKWLGGFTPTAGVLALSSWVNANQATVQKVVDALVATMHWLSTHTAADVANVLPPSFVNNTLVTKSVYISTLSTDKTQFLPDGLMPSDGPNTIMAISKLAGIITGPVNLSTTYTNSYAVAANKALGFSG